MMAAAPPPDLTTDANAGRSEQPSAATRTNQYAEFYFTDEIMVFQVENRLLHVHRYFLAENSLVFSSMFSLPHGAQLSSTAAEGTSDANPIYLSSMTELEFETLLGNTAIRVLGIISIYDGFTLPQTSWAEKYDLLLRDVVPLLLPFVVREGLLKEGEILRFSALTVSRLGHAQEDFQRDRGSLNWRPLGPDAKAIVYRIWRV